MSRLVTLAVRVGSIIKIVHKWPESRVTRGEMTCRVSDGRNGNSSYLRVINLLPAPGVYCGEVGDTRGFWPPTMLSTWEIEILEEGGGDAITLSGVIEDPIENPGPLVIK